MKENKNTAQLGIATTAAQLRGLRLRAGLTQEQAAEDLSCSSRTIQRYEAGETTPDYPTLRRMMDVYKCEAAELFEFPPLFSKETGGVL